MTGPDFKQNFVFDMYEYRYGTLSLMVSQFNCNCIPFGISLGHKWHLLRLLAAQLIVHLIIYTSCWKSSERLYLIVLSTACCCVQKSQVGGSLFSSLRC